MRNGVVCDTCLCESTAKGGISTLIYNRAILSSRGNLQACSLLAGCSNNTIIEIIASLSNGTSECVSLADRITIAIKTITTIVLEITCTRSTSLQPISANVVVVAELGIRATVVRSVDSPALASCHSALVGHVTRTPLSRNERQSAQHKDNEDFHVEVM